MKILNENNPERKILFAVYLLLETLQLITRTVFHILKIKYADVPFFCETLYTKLVNQS